MTLKEKYLGLVLVTVCFISLVTGIGVGSGAIPHIYGTKLIRNKTTKQAILLQSECPHCGEFSLEVDHSYASGLQLQHCSSCGYSISYDLSSKTKTLFSEGYGSYMINHKDGSRNYGILYEEPTEKFMANLKSELDSDNVDKENSYIKIVIDGKLKNYN